MIDLQHSTYCVAALKDLIESKKRFTREIYLLISGTARDQGIKRMEVTNTYIRFFDADDAETTSDSIMHLIHKYIEHLGINWITPGTWTSSRGWSDTRCTKD